MKRDKKRIDTTKIATDLRSGLGVKFSWAPKRRELFILRAESQGIGLPPKIQVPMLFEDPLRAGVNLISSRDYHVTVSEKLDRARRIPRFTLRMLGGGQALPREKDGYLISRFVPFLAQHVACTVGEFKCETCPMFYPCVMSQIPLGVLVNIAPERYSTHYSDGSFRLYDVTFKGISNSFQGTAEMGMDFEPEFLRNVCNVSMLYGYPGLFDDYPAFEDCFHPIPTRRN